MSDKRQADSGLHRLMSTVASERAQLVADIDASESERKALAAWLDVPSVPSLKAHVERRIWRTNGIEIEGRLSADVERVCGVSLERFVEHAEAEFVRRYHPDASAAADIPQGELVLDVDEEDPEPMPGTSLDVGAIVAEELSLALDPFPRKPGAALGEEAAAAAARDEKPNSFAALARLKGGDKAT
jgi:uncharacterized metal-binding protein YceD (DUF177 family)